MKVTISGATGRFYCPGCKAYHTFFATAGNFNGDKDNPTVTPRLVYANGGGQVMCTLSMRDGQLSYSMDSRHRLAGQTVETPDISGAVPK